MSSNLNVYSVSISGLDRQRHFNLHERGVVEHAYDCLD